MPRSVLGKDIMRLSFQHEQYDKEIESLKKTRDDLYEKSRVAEEKLLIIAEREENKKEWSAKTWVLIMSAMTVILNAIFRYL